MRTKVLLCAALVAAGALSAMAQNVYSLNIVGYVNVSIPAGYSILANPLSAGATNGVNEIMPIIPDSQFLSWNGSGFDTVMRSSIINDWVDPANPFTPVPPPTMPPGKGFFFYTTAATNVTFVGQVVPGPATTNSVALAAGYSLIGSQLPISLTDISTQPNGLPLVPDMQILKWNGSGFTTTMRSSIINDWVDPANPFTPVPAPSLTVGQGFFFYTVTPTTWVQGLP